MKLILAPLLVLASLLGSTNAFAGDLKPDCLKAYEESQTLRRAGQLIDARDRAITCSQPACPKRMVPECSMWASEIGAAIPTTSPWNSLRLSE